MEFHLNTDLKELYEPIARCGRFKRHWIIHFNRGPQIYLAFLVAENAVEHRMYIKIAL